MYWTIFKGFGKNERFLLVCKTCQDLKNCLFDHLFKPLFGQIITEGLVFVRIGCYLPKRLKKISDFWLRQYF